MPMPSPAAILLSASIPIGASAAMAQPVMPPVDPGLVNPAPSEETVRVGGDTEATTTRIGPGLYETACGCSLESPIPENYPAPTPPDAIEIKHFPSVRRAEISGTSDAQQASWNSFMPLFNHIKEREIAMTSPVEMDYEGMSSDDPSVDRWTMSFLYRTQELGPTGTDGRIEIVDTEPVKMLCIGLRGAYGMRTTARGLAELEGWLAGQDEWEQAGPPRGCSYNGPYVPNRRKWAEVQLPIKRVVRAEPAATVSDQ